MKAFRKIICFAIALLVSTGFMFSHCSKDASAGDTITGSINYDYANKVLELVNIERKNAGANPLTMDVTLTDAALVRTAEINVFFMHTRPNGSKCFTAITNVGDATAFGENIAAGQSTPEDVVESWMNSPKHRENILDPDFTRVGIGCMQTDGDYGVYWTQVFANGSYSELSASGTEAFSASFSTGTINYSNSGNHISNKMALNVEQPVQTPTQAQTKAPQQAATTAPQQQTDTPTKAPEQSGNDSNNQNQQQTSQTKPTEQAVQQDASNTAQTTNNQVTNANTGNNQSTYYDDMQDDVIMAINNYTYVDVSKLMLTVNNNSIMDEALKIGMDYKTGVTVLKSDEKDTADSTDGKSVKYMILEGCKCSSSNNDVISVTDGVMKVIKPGTATIFVTDVRGTNIKFDVTVDEKGTFVKAISSAKSNGDDKSSVESSKKVEKTTKVINKNVQNTNDEKTVSKSYGKIFAITGCIITGVIALCLIIFLFVRKRKKEEN